MKPPPVDLRIDREGRWFADGREVVHEKIYRLFCDSLVRENGAYLIRVDYMENPVTVDDAPFSVRSLFVENAADGTDIVWLLLNDTRMVKLDPGTLRAPAEDALYCAVPDGRGFDARFSPLAMQRFASIAEYDEEQGVFSLELNGRKYFLKITPGIK